jgi:hypothetical protein
MNKPAEFYLYQGEGKQIVPASLRACRRIGAVEHNGRTVVLVNIDPPIPPGTVPPGVRSDVIGLSQQGPKPFDGLSPGETANVLLWEVYDFGGGQLGVALESRLGFSTICKTRPMIDSRGRIMDAPAAARAFVNSVIRALEEGGEPKK